MTPAVGVVAAFAVAAATAADVVGDGGTVDADMYMFEVTQLLQQEAQWCRQLFSHGCD